MVKTENAAVRALETAPRKSWLATRRRRKMALDWLSHLLLLAGAAAFVFPFLWMLVRSVTPTDQIFGARLFPTELSLDHFRQIFARDNFGVYFLNSAAVCFFSVTLGVFFDSLAGFALAKGVFPGKDKLFWVIVSTMMIPVYTVLVPTFIVLTELGLRNTLAGLIVPGLASASGIFIMTQNIKTVPDSLLDAAKVDGCGLFGIYARMVLPTVRPALGALAVIRFLGAWNSYLIPLIMISDDGRKTIPLGLTTLMHQHGLVRWGALMAGSLVSTLPIIIFFLFMQKQFVSGITLDTSEY